MPAPVSSLIRTVDAVIGGDPLTSRVVPVAVWEVLSTVPDPRQARGRRHDLASVLLIALAAVLAGSRSLAAIAEWAKDVPRWAWPRLGIIRAVPSHSTIRRVLLLVDPDVLDAVLHAWLATRTDPVTPPAPSGPVPAAFTAVAVDGKTCRGARTGDGSRVHLFSMVDHATGVPLGQVNAGGKDHEIAAFATVLDRIDLRGLVVTGDALHTQRAHARYLHRHGGSYVFTVKRNQPSLHDQLAGLPWANVPVGHHAQEKGHGRRESRTLQVVSVRAGIGFPHARRAARVVRTRTELSTGKAGSETVYVVTNLTDAQADPTQLAGLLRGHWSIENRVHHVRDMAYDEDRHQLRTGTGPRVMAGLRNVAIGIIRARMTGQGIASATRALGRRLDRVLDLVDHEKVTPVTGASTLN